MYYSSFYRILQIFKIMQKAHVRLWITKKNPSKIDRVLLLSNVGLLEQLLTGDAIIYVHYWLNGL